MFTNPGGVADAVAVAVPPAPPCTGAGTYHQCIGTNEQLNSCQSIP